MGMWLTPERSVLACFWKAVSADHWHCLFAGLDALKGPTNQRQAIGDLASVGLDANHVMRLSCAGVPWRRSRLCLDLHVVMRWDA